MMSRARMMAERTRLLRELRGRRFERFRFRGLDALVARLPEGESVPPAVNALLTGPTPMRVYPIAGGYLYKWPHPGGLPPAGFAVEAGGWDHDHCGACNRTINVNRTAWLTVRGSAWCLCPYCYRRVVQLRSAGVPNRVHASNRG